MNVKNLAYQCNVNVYLKDILPKKDCNKKDYLSGGWSAPYFSVGYEVKTDKGDRYFTQYIYTPEKENSDRLAWRDASATHFYVTSFSPADKNKNQKPSHSEMLKQLNKGLETIKKYPEIYHLLGKQFFIPALKENGFYLGNIKESKKPPTRK